MGHILFLETDPTVVVDNHFWRMTAHYSLMKVYGGLVQHRSRDSYTRKLLTRLTEVFETVVLLPLPPPPLTCPFQASGVGLGQACGLFKEVKGCADWLRIGIHCQGSSTCEARRGS